jgi:hypothetical protein
MRTRTEERLRSLEIALTAKVEASDPFAIASREQLLSLCRQIVDDEGAVPNTEVAQRLLAECRRVLAA